MLLILSRPLNKLVLDKVVFLLTSRISTLRPPSSSKWISSIKNASPPCKSLQIYKQMRRQSIHVDSYTIIYTLTACTHMHNLPLLCHLHTHITKLGFTTNVFIMSSLLHGYSNACFYDACTLFDEMPERTTVTWNTMITGFSRFGNLDKAKSLFDEMPLRNVASWSAMIAAYVNSGHRKKGLALLYEMLVHEKLNPDQFTLSTILSACGHMGTIGSVMGKSIHGYVTKNEWELNVQLGTALVDMYAKCGVLKDACTVFHTMQDTNVVSWTALICGAAQHGYVQKARTLFQNMQDVGVKPNEFTFTGILNACVQAGLVEEGRRYFGLIEEYGLKPKVHHYCCMVDLFGKAGELEDAYEIIIKMQPEANMNVYGSFLYSCKVHNNFKMAERVIDTVVAMLKPKDGGVYTLIADLFVMGGRWNDAEKMRSLMVSQNVMKARGASFISSCGT